MGYISKNYLSTQFTNFATRLTQVFAKKSTTLSGYGITDAKISNGTITLGDNTMDIVSTSSNGVCPKVTNTNAFLRGDGTWATPTATLTWNE